MTRILEFEVPPSKPVRRGFDYYWQVIRDLDRDGPWSVSDVRRRCRPRQPARSSIMDFVRRLVAGGYVANADSADTSAIHYRIVEGKAQRATPCIRRDGKAGIQGRGQVHMWNVMRGPLGRDGFAARDLVLYGTTETVGIKPETAKAYLQRLSKAGYLVQVFAGRGGKPTRWRLKPAMNTGPKPPMILRTDLVFDQNRNAVVGAVEASEVSR